MAILPGVLAASRSALLEEYTGAVAAFSTRQISRAYTGYAMKVREGSGMNYEADVSFDASGNVSLTSPIANLTGGSGATLGDFVSSSDAFCTLWYDQSGEGNNATQSTAGAQPKIVSSGTVVNQGGIPVVDFDGSDDGLTIADTADLSFTDGSGTDTPAAFFVAHNLNELSSGNTLISKDAGGSAREWAWFFDGSDQRFYIKSGGGGNQQSADDDDTATGWHLASLLYSGNESYSGMQFYRNGAASTMDDTLSQTYSGMSNTSSTVLIGNRYTGACISTEIAEIVIYKTDQAATRAGIETAINTHYSIY